MSIKDKYPFNHIWKKLDPPKTVYAGPDYFEKNAAGVYAGPDYFSAPVAPPAEEYPAPTYAGPEMYAAEPVDVYAGPPLDDEPYGENAEEETDEKR